MFERYSESARRVIFYARYEASRLRHESIEPRHILLGMLRENPNFLKSFHLSGEATEAIVRDLSQSGTVDAPLSRDMPLDAAAQRVLAQANAEAEALQHATIEPGHILLGILREKDNDVAPALLLRGLQFEWVLAAVTQSKKVGAPLRLVPRVGVFEYYDVVHDVIVAQVPLSVGLLPALGDEVAITGRVYRVEAVRHIFTGQPVREGLEKVVVRLRFIKPS